ncbi:MAG: methyl-accepting chemotaxis protein [Halanaerobium sp.]
MLKLNLKAKLIIFFLAVGIISVLVVGLFSYNTAQREIEEQAFNTLEMYSAIAGDTLETYFKEREGDARVFATTTDVYESMNILAINEYNVNNKQWQRRVNILEDLAPVMVEEYGYAFAFLTDLEGNVVYSTNEKVTGADLSDRDYIQRSLGGETNWSELFFSDVINENSMIISIPVRGEGIEGEIIGSANLLMDQNGIDHIIHNGIENLGESGDSYLIDEDGLLLTNTLLGEYAQDSALKKSINTRAVELLSGPISSGDLNFSATETYLDYFDNPVLGDAAVVEFGGENAGLVVEIDQSEVFAGVNQLRTYMIIIILIVALVIAIIAFFIARSIANPIIAATGIAETIAEGNLTERVPEKYKNRKDEIGTLANAIEKMIKNLKKLVGSVADISSNLSASSEELSASGEEVATAASQIGDSIQQVASGAEEQSAQVEETSSNIEELIMQIQDVKKNSDEMDNQADNVMNNINEGNTSINESVEKIKNVKNNSTEVSNTINGLGELSNKIGEIVGLINDIAAQTNLLALNAAIEAARAGEAGRGFSVVADEIRQLAEESEEATTQIDGLVKEIQSGVGNAVRKMDNTEKVVDDSVNAIDTTGQSFKKINAAAETLRKLIAEISNKADIVNKGSNEIDSSVKEIASVSQEAASNSEEVAAASEEQSASTEEIVSAAEDLANMANNLTEAVNKFKM